MGQRTSMPMTPKGLPRKAASDSVVGAGDVTRRFEDICEIEHGTGFLGKGAFGTVWRGKLRSKRGCTVAVKTMDKSLIAKKGISVSQVFSEIEVMLECAGKAQVVQLHDFLETPTTFFLIMEYCDGGSLEKQVALGTVGDREVVRIMKQLFNGIAFLHQTHICHRDVKPQNLMIVNNIFSDHMRVKLGDFGLAVHFHEGNLLRDKIGTPAFMSPELHLLPAKSTGYDSKVDVWAAGVVMVFLLAYQFCLLADDNRFLYDPILHGNLPLWDMRMFSCLFQEKREDKRGSKRPSALARFLVRRLLAPNRHQRLNAVDALKHEWFSAPSSCSDSDGDDTTLLVWQDFQVGLSDVEKERRTSLRAALVEANAPPKPQWSAPVVTHPTSPLRTLARTPSMSTNGGTGTPTPAWVWSSHESEDFDIGTPPKRNMSSWPFSSPPWDPCAVRTGSPAPVSQPSSPWSRN